MKGIILAGGSGTRLMPCTKLVCKQLLPVYDKPMIYYPLYTLIEAGIKDILIITTPKDILNFKLLLNTGSQWGVNIRYEVQYNPLGIAQAFTIGEKFIGKDSVTLILGDNIFHGDMSFYRKALTNNVGATIFGYHVRDPERFGIVEFDDKNNVLSIEEKPKSPKSPYAIPGLYIYDNTVIQRTKKLIPSERNELEITDLNKSYLSNNLLRVHKISCGVSWLDTGTFESLLEASNYISIIQKQQNIIVAPL